MVTRGLRVLVVAALLALLLALAVAGVLPLLAWTKRVFPLDRMPLAFTLFFAGWWLQRLAPPARRPPILLALSLALVALFSLRFLTLLLVWLWLLHRVLYSAVAHRWKLAFVAATFAGCLLACHVPLAPRLHAAHPELLTWGYVFAAGLGFRVVWALHEARVAPARPSLLEFLLYFVFAPFFLVLPYMFAIPRPDAFRASLARHDLEVEWSGVRMLAASLAIGAALHLFTTQVWSPRHAFELALRQGQWTHAVLSGLAYYPGEVTAIAVSGSGVLIGLVRLLGVALAPSFDRPLAARSITEWWQRWNTHFRDLLVELFWYPVMLRFRRRPYLGIWLGCASVFLVGSVLLHWLAKHPFHHGSLRSLPVGIVFESVAMTVVVGASMSWARWRQLRGAAPSPRWPARALAHLRTYVVVFSTVVGVGYTATYLFTIRPFERLAPVVARAHAALALGRRAEAAVALAPVVDELRALALEEPLDSLRQSAAALALALPGPARDLAAAADHLALARATLDPAVASHHQWLAAAQATLAPGANDDGPK